MRWSIGYFGAKDLFTMVNLLGGVAAIYFACRGEPVLGAYAILAGYLFGDALDGQVARLTNTSNRFGSEFDSAADHIGQGIAPAVVLYAAYEQLGHGTLGLVLMAALISTASIRQARFNVARFDFPLCYCGLPRTVSGLVALSMPNAPLFFIYTGYGPWLGVVVVAILAVLNLTPIPYMTHRGGRPMQRYVKLLVLSFLASPFVLFVVARPHVWDAIFAYTFSYAVLAWIPISPDERRAFYAEYRAWARQVATLK